MNVPERNKIDKNFKWNLADIYASPAEWEADFAALSREKETLLQFKGRLKDPKILLDCLNKESAIMKKMYKLYSYAHMNLDADTRDEKNKDRQGRCETLLVKISAINSFIWPEILEGEADEIVRLSKLPEFLNFSYYLTELARRKQHVLTEKEEKLISETASFSWKFGDIFYMFDNADVKFKPVTDEHGNEVQMSHGNYSVLLQSTDRRVRREAFESMFTAFADMKNTLAAVYGGEVKRNNFYAKVKNYGGARAMAMEAENVAPKVYDNLISAVSENIGGLHRYMEFRKNVMKLDKLHMYDMHAALFEGENISLGYDEAYRLVETALKPLGEEYAELLKTAKTNGWIDVYENKGKRSGAYSSDAYGVHPYVLLNYKQTTHDVFTIAHELGHAMHTYFSNKNQCFEKSDYTIFVAEVASTVNEVLLLKHLLKDATGKKRKFLLSYYLDMFRTTVFRQTMFAEFEDIAHKAAQNDVSLTPEFLNGEYFALNKKYYGNAVEHDKLIESEWSRIPHFYSAFYVYKYATGLASAVIIANRIFSGDKTALENYFKFLSAGGSADPVSVLRLAGVDLEQKGALSEAFSEFTNTLKMLEDEELG